MRVNLFAEAKINGKTVCHPVIPCDTFSQAFAYDHLLPAEDFYVMPRNPWQQGKKSGKLGTNGNKKQKDGKKNVRQNTVSPVAPVQGK